MSCIIPGSHGIIEQFLNQETLGNQKWETQPPQIPGKEETSGEMVLNILFSAEF